MTSPFPTRPWTRAAALAALFAQPALACGDSGEAPLGGPYGGEVRHLGPTDGGYANVDATFTPPAPPPAAGVTGAPGTWTHIYFAYLAEGTIGNCALAGCHSEMSSPSASYAWLREHGYVGGTDPLLTNAGASCLSWYGGGMPPGGPESHTEATTEMDTWARAGGLEN